MEKEIINVQTYKTPSIPGVGILKPAEDESLIIPLKQDQFRSSVGSMLYLVKNSRPDMDNSVR